MSEWISVNDRLPKTWYEPENLADFSDKVIVYGYYGVGVAELWRTENDYGWNGGEGYKPKNITHWMPLPKPPKERSE